MASLAALWPASSRADELPAPLTDYFLEVWNARSGLPHSTVNAIAQTPDGYLWFGTWEGAARYNGREFVNFDRERVPGLPDSGIRALRVDHDGALLVGGGRGGLVRREGVHWTAFDPAPAQITKLLRDSKGRLWVAMESAGALRIDPDGTRTLYNRDNGLPGATVSALAEDAKGRIWLGSSGGLIYFEGKALQPLSAQSRLASTPVLALTLDQEKNLLVGTDHGIFVARDSEQPEHFESLNAALDNESVSSLLVDRAGNLWIGTLNRGLLRWSARGLEPLGLVNGLPSSRVVTLFEDREKNIWVGTNGGLLRLSDAPFSSATHQSGLADDFARAVLPINDGSLWVATSLGVSRIDKHGITPVAMTGASPQLSVLSLAQAADGDVWIGSYTQGALRWHEGHIIERLDVEHGLIGNEVRAILPARDGTLWLGTTRGLSRVSADGIRNYGKADGLPDTYVVSLLESQRGEIWVGTGIGVAIIDDHGIRQLDIKSLNDAEFVFGITEDRANDAIWLATDRGLIRYRSSDQQLATIGLKQGLPFDKLFNVVADRIGNLWLTGNRGVVRISHRDAIAVADGRRSHLTHERYTEADGMASSQCNGGSMPSSALGQDGSVWIATALGVAHVQPERLAKFSATPPPVVIESLQVDDQSYEIKQDQQLPAGSQRIEMEFAGLSYVLSSRILYRYRLIGFDRNWVESGTRKSAQFTNLPPGDYELRVAASHPNGQWNSEEATLRFSIAPFFWQRPIFQAGGVLLLALLVGLGVRWRLRALQNSERRLRELVESRTADLRLQAERLIAADAEKSELFRQLQQQSEAFAQQAREDALTGLMNRRAFDEALSHEFARAKRTGNPLCLVLLDIDHFKRVNDQWSHAVGDEVLKAVADQMRQQFRSIDLVARWGGEEFAVLLPDTSLNDAHASCERLRNAIETMDCSQFAPGLQLTVSLGIASHIGLSHHEKLLFRADAALYQAKETGRNRVCA